MHISSQVNQILTDRKREDLLLTEDDQDRILKLISFLMPFKEESEKLEADTKPTLQFVLLAFHRLLRHCDPKEGDCNVIAKLRSRARSLLQEKFELHDMHKIACFLWPRYRRLKMLSANEREKVT